ncbi:CDP-glycerol glycerophosphotransferase family protein [Demequina sp. NBRC 110053]|uniref:CDP-glycerol glycerophosphotransferase family protein n=1 Tax=Demequina sp. NBRC 110053 TaxID=1570342 RepID=UPI000A051B99|nr:CDP-glycerol glycerophosphotransferase family protein [Demequina sp. NBRC 110053]
MLRTVRRQYRRARGFAARAVRALQDRTLGDWYYARLPIDPDLVVYTSLWNRAPRGNPLAIYRKQLELAPHLRGVWIVRKQDLDQLPAGIEYVTPRTLAYLRLIATATYFVDDANPHWSLAAREGQIYVQTHHGTALKYMGADRHYSGVRPSDDTIVTMHRRSQRWTYSLSTSPYLTEVWERAYNNDCVQLEVGFPRNDVLFESTAEDRAAVRARLGLAPHERAVLYMPTWRTRRSPKEHEFDLTAFAESLPEGTRLLVRDHYYHDRRGRQVVPAQVIDVSKGWEVEDLYLASDALITDYSSAMFDYTLLDRPIVLFCYDWDDYRWSRGAYFDITADAPGQVVFDAEALAETMRTGEFLAPSFAGRRASFRDRFATFENGRAAETVVRVALLGEDAEPYARQVCAAEHPAGWTTHPRVTWPEDPSREPHHEPLGRPSSARFVTEASPAEVEAEAGDDPLDTDQLQMPVVPTQSREH